MPPTHNNNIARNDSNQIMPVAIVVDGFTLGDASVLETPSSWTISDMKAFLKSTIHNNPKYSNLNIEEFHLWRVLIPRPSYHKDSKRLHRNLVILSEINIKCKLVDNHEVGGVLDEYNYPKWMMLAVIEPYP
ncbi:MAG: hypothetical protein J3R72DRAFT_421174 [Linnemannia gamsii]|nr:MAG: hypothetical protein J3R72DRAFT_421174 [Linnemannia gamsii]